MSAQVSNEYSDQLTGGARKTIYYLLGFILGPIGLVVACLVARRRNYFPYVMEAAGCAIVGWGFFYIAEFICVKCGVPVPFWAGFDQSYPGWHIFILVIACLHICLWGMWVYGMKWKQTERERTTPLHGDEWVKPGEPHMRYDGGITLDCTADDVWPHVRQCGQTKAGWYSFDWLERLCTFHITNHYTIHPEWQSMKVGDFQWFHQAPLTIGEFITEVDHDNHYFAAHSDTRVDEEGPNEERAFKVPGLKYFCWTWNWHVYDIDSAHCRFIWRCDCTFSPYNRPVKWLLVFTLGTASVVMGRNFMDVMQRVVTGKQKITAKHV